MSELRELSQHQKIIMHMLYRMQDQLWFLAGDFIRLGSPLNVGYEASARLSELVKRYPSAFASEPYRNFKKRRLRFETIDQWFELLDKDLRWCFHNRQVTPETVGKLQYQKPNLFSAVS